MAILNLASLSQVQLYPIDLNRLNVEPIKLMREELS